MKTLPLLHLSYLANSILLYLFTIRLFVKDANFPVLHLWRHISHQIAFKNYNTES
jgi:hypothetical protein